MLNSFLTFINQHKLNLNNQYTLLTVSGGVDSVVMLNLFYKAGFKAAIAHCNFGLRGEESNSDEQFVRELGQKYGFPFFVERFDTKNYASEQAISTQMAARDLRYAWFEKIREENSIQWIATAHHANDNIETALLNLTRGTGIAGLHGIAVQNKSILRPLLFATKEEILSYANESKLTWREDKSNDSLDYKRNVIRKSVVPVLKELNPSLESTFMLTSERLRAGDELLSGFLKEWEKTVLEKKEDEMHISIEGLLEADNPIYRLWFILDSYGFSYTQTSQIVKSFDALSGKVFHSDTHKLLKDRDVLILKKHSTTEMPAELIVSGLIGEYSFADRRLCFEYVDSWTIDKDTNVIYLEESKLKLPLVVRQWKKADNFQPFGMNGKSKKVSDLLIDLKLNRFEKENVHVLVNGNAQIIWVIGLRSDDRFKLNEKSSAIIKLTNSKL